MDNIDGNGIPGEYDPETNTYRVVYDQKMPEPVSTIIVKTVAVLTDSPPTELDPLYDILNSDALNHIYHFDPQSTQDQSESHIMFTYNGCDVRVFATGIIEVEPPSDLER